MPRPFVRCRSVGRSDADFCQHRNAGTRVSRPIIDRPPNCSRSIRQNVFNGPQFNFNNIIIYTLRGVRIVLYIVFTRATGRRDDDICYVLLYVRPGTDVKRRGEGSVLLPCNNIRSGFCVCATRARGLVNSFAKKHLNHLQQLYSIIDMYDLFLSNMMHRVSFSDDACGNKDSVFFSFSFYCYLSLILQFFLFTKKIIKYHS